MPGQEFTLQASIEIDGSPLPRELEPALERVVVDDHLHLPDMFVLSFRDLDRKVLSAARLEIGSQVKISGTPLGGRLPEMLLSGEVTAIEADYDALGARATVRGYDHSHRLHRGRRTETYRNVKDSDIAAQVAQRAGVKVGAIEDSRATHDHVSQANVTDWEFLRARAREIGYEVLVADGKLDFRKPLASSGAPGDGDFASKDPLQLVFGQDLLEFRPRITSAEQVREVRVRGWDPISKQALVGLAPAGTTSAKLPVGPEELARKFGDPTYVAVDRPLSTQGGVDAAAAAIAEQIGSAFAEADGIARGNPKLKAGAAVSVSVVADQFAGGYTLTHTRHIFDHEGYRTQLVVSGRQERSILGLASGGASNGHVSAGGPPIYGVVVAQVTNNDDPDELGRVKLKFPWLADGYESDWARMTQLGAGPDSGAVFLPEVNDEVLVAFEFGDVRRPYVLGSVWNGVDRPNLGNHLVDNGAVRRRGFVSRRGHRFVFFDDESKSGIALLTSDGRIRLALNETEGEVHLVCEGTVVLEAQGNIDLRSQGRVTIDGSAGLSLSSSATVEIKGSLIKLN
jgi:phage protein D